MECSSCDKSNSLLCSGCVSVTQLKLRINLVKAQSELSSLQHQVNTKLATANKLSPSARTEISHLIKKISSLKSSLQELELSIKSLKVELKRIQTEASNSEKEIEHMKSKSIQQHIALSQHSTSGDGLLETTYRDTLLQSLKYQASLCKDLLEVFQLKIKNKKSSQEVILGANLIPELTKLGHHPVYTLNGGFERLSYFLVHLSNYLALQLPFEITLPTQTRPKVLIGPLNEALNLTHPLKLVLQSSPKEFYNYCKLISMLALNVAYISIKIANLSPLDIASVAQMTPLLVKLYLVLESSIAKKSYIRIYPQSLSIDLDSLQDYIIIKLSEEINGSDAVWNIL